MSAFWPAQPAREVLPSVSQGLVQVIRGPKRGVATNIQPLAGSQVVEGERLRHLRPLHKSRAVAAQPPGRLAIY